VGHWGYQWYAERAGAQPVTRDGLQPQRGDYVVSSSADRCTALSYIPRRTLLRHWTYNTAGGRIMSTQDQAGFYSNIFGYLPWSWGSGEIDRFELWRVD
jgi:hypothetical protein